MGYFGGERGYCVGRAGFMVGLLSFVFGLNLIAVGGIVWSNQGVEREIGAEERVYPDVDD